MNEKAVSPLRGRLIEDTAMRRLNPETQHHYHPSRQKLCGFPWLVS
jgi:hypothetical protein